MSMGVEMRVAISNSEITLAAGFILGCAVGALCGAGMISCWDIGAGDVMSLVGSIGGAAMTVCAAVFWRGSNDRRLSAVAATAAVAACDHTLPILKNAAQISPKWRNFKESLRCVSGDLKKAYKVVTEAANAPNLHPDCARAGFDAMDAIRDAIWSLNPNQAADEQSFSSNKPRMDRAFSAINAFRAKAAEEANMMT